MKTVIPILLGVATAIGTAAFLNKAFQTAPEEWEVPDVPAVNGLPPLKTQLDKAKEKGDVVTVKTES